MSQLAASLGVGGGTGRNTAINRTIVRLADFGMAHLDGDTLEVEMHWPALPPRLQRRLTLGLADQLPELSPGRPPASSSAIARGGHP